MVKEFEEGVYYLFHKDSKSPKRSYIGIRYPGVNSTPLIVIGGKRSKDIYRFIIQLLENNGIKYSLSEEKKEKIIELPLATGLASSVFLLAVYSTTKPLKYAVSLERMILGKMPLTKYFIATTELATELSNYFGKSGEKSRHRKQVLETRAAKVASKMLIQLLQGLE
jgi:hypothetical protein